jgi:hypothetical protein
MSNLMADQDSSPTSGCPNNESFLVRSNNSDFSGRQNQIFDQLDNLAKQYDRDVIARHDPPPPEPEVEDLRTPDDVFVVPTRRPPPRRRFPTRCGNDNITQNHYKPPDHRIHPEKWTRYSLDDVTEDQMTEKSNSAAAFEFLSRNKFEVTSASSQVTRFNVQCGKRKVNEAEETPSPRSSTSSGKWVMPEYVVGRKAPSVTTRKVLPAMDSTVSNRVPLAHLEVVDGDADTVTEKTKDDADAFKVPKRNFKKGNLRGRSTDMDI